MPTLSVVICSYKYGHLAAHAVDSVISQTLKPNKIYFIDDGVGDCRHIPKLYPQVIFIEREKNLGTVENFQRALEMIDTDRVMFLGADNWLRQDALECLNKCPEDIVTYDIILTGENAEKFAQQVGAQKTLSDSTSRIGFIPGEGYYVWQLKPSNINESNFCHGSSLYNVSLAKRVGGYKRGKGVHTEEDHQLFKAMINAGATWRMVRIPLLYYRRHKENFNQ